MEKSVVCVVRNFATEAPYVVTQLGGGICSSHYIPKAAIVRAKSANGFRVIHGRHQGVWKPLLAYFKGVRYEIRV
jgi:hypothetical protein